MNQLRPCLISYTARGQAISKPRHHARQDLLRRSARSVVLGVAAELGDDKEVGWLYLQKEREKERIRVKFWSSLIRSEIFPHQTTIAT